MSFVNPHINPLRAKMAYSVRTSQRTLLPTERPDGECSGGKQKLTDIKTLDRKAEFKVFILTVNTFGFKWLNV